MKEKRKSRQEVSFLNSNYKILKLKDKKVSQAGFWFTHTQLSTTSLLVVICKGTVQAIY